MTLMLIFGFIAVILAAVGIYGVVSYANSLRRDEMATRLALGASPSDVFTMVLRQGALLGLLGGYVLARTLESRLFGLEPLDPASFALATSVFILTAAIACWIPTRRAVRVDPVRALKTE